MTDHNDEERPLLSDNERGHGNEDAKLVEFEKDDEDHPRNWNKWKKLSNIAVIASMAILSPLASSMFAPGIGQIAEYFDSTESAVIGCQTGFVIMLGIGPLILAPLSETFGRKKLYLACFGVFGLLQIPTALSPNLPFLIACRTIAGFFGSVGIANGGGTISDMYKPQERASILGWYLLGPLLGPTIGPLLGGLIMQSLPWQWMFWILSIICAVANITAFFLLKETYAPQLLKQRKADLEAKEGGKYYLEDDDDSPLTKKIGLALQRPMKILFTQPIVFVMASLQAMVFAITYSLFTQFPNIYGDDYGFNTSQVGCVYLAPGLGFLVSVWVLVPRIDTIYNHLTEKNGGQAKPEFRLPLANVGAILMPIALFEFAWTAEFKVHWAVTMIGLFFYGFGQTALFSATQNYYIDAFEKYAASAIAAGAFFRSVIGGIVPLFTPALFSNLGVGVGMSIYASVAVALAPAPILFYYYGERLRHRFAVKL